MSKVRKRDIYLAISVDALNAFMFTNVIYSLFFESRGVGLAQVGFILASYQFAKILFEIPTGIVADLYGHKKSVLIGFLVQQVALLLMLISNHAMFLIACNIIRGFGFAFISGALEAFIYETVKEAGEEKNITHYNALNRSVWLISYGLSAVVSGFIAYHSYELVFILTILIQIIPFLLLMLLKEPSLECEIKEKVVNPFKQARNAMQFASKNQIIYFLIFIFVWFTIVDIPLDSFYPNYFKTIGIDERMVGMTMMVLTAVSSLAGFLSQKVSTLIGERFILRYFFIFAAISALLVGFTHSFYLLLILIVVKSLLVGIAMPIRYKYLHRNLTSEYRATIISIASFIMALSAAACLPLFGFLSNTISFKAGFIILAAVAIVVLIVNNVRFNRVL